MRIDFFEEFPHSSQLQPARWIDFPSTVFLAAWSLAGFHQLQARLADIHDGLSTAYWPLLRRSYWLSPCSSARELRRLSQELRQPAAPERWLFDLELPYLRPRALLRRHAWLQRKAELAALFATAKRNGRRVYCAEYPVTAAWQRSLLQWSGLAWSPGRQPHTRVTMCYGSIIRWGAIRRRILDDLSRAAREKGTTVAVGVGTLALGVDGREPVLSPSELARDLSALQARGLGHAIIFRLGGLTRAHLEVVQSFVS